MIHDPLKALSATLRLRITESTYTAADVARALGLDRSAVSRWMTGERTPTVQNLIDLAALLGVEVQELWSGPEAIPATPEQRAMVDEMKDLDPAQQQALLALARSMRPPK